MDNAVNNNIICSIKEMSRVLLGSGLVAAVVVSMVMSTIVARTSGCTNMVKPTTEVNKNELTNCNTLPTGTCVAGGGGTFLLSMQFVQQVQFVQ